MTNKSPWDHFCEVNKRLPTSAEFSNMDHSFIHEDCEHPEASRKDGYGLAGGGMGVYTFCNKCNRVLCKDETGDF